MSILQRLQRLETVSPGCRDLAQQLSVLQHLVALQGFQLWSNAMPFFVGGQLERQPGDEAAPEAALAVCPITENLVYKSSRNPKRATNCLVSCAAEAAVEACVIWQRRLTHRHQAQQCRPGLMALVLLGSVKYSAEALRRNSSSSCPGASLKFDGSQRTIWRMHHDSGSCVTPAGIDVCRPLRLLLGTLALML